MKASDEGWLRSIAYLVKLKAIYKNCTFYNYSLRKVSEKVHCSPATLSHHLKVLEQHGLIRLHAGNLTITGLNKINKELNSETTVGIPVRKLNQYDIVRSLLIKFSLQRQLYRIRKRRVKKLRKISNMENANSSYAGLTCKGIGRLYGLSKESGSRIRRKLEKLGFIKRERKYKSLAEGVCYEQYRILKYDNIIPGHSFFSGGQVLVETFPKLTFVERRDIVIN